MQPSGRERPPRTFITLARGNSPLDRVLAVAVRSPIPATNRCIRGKGVEFIRIENGKVVEERLYFDQLEFLTDLGLMEAPAPA